MLYKGQKTNVLLLAFLVLGTALRFGQLTRKPLWVDEIFTAIFSLGQNFDRIPVEVPIPLGRIREIFTLDPQASCGEIAQNLALQSTHPPLFFCLMHQWLVGLQPWDLPLAWQLRALPALFGVGAIAAVYLLNRLAFSPKAGLMGAAFVAVSPFGVYQSQEARHYTLPVAIVALALIFLLQMQRDLQDRRIRPLLWLGWAMANTLSLYVHYFCFLALTAQIATLAFKFWLLFQPKVKASPPNLMGRVSDRKLSNRLEIESNLTLVVLAASFCLLPFLLYFPWWPILVQHFNSPKAGWLPEPQHIAPIVQMAVAVVLMVIAPPVESQPIWVIIPVSLLTLLVLVWFVPRLYQGFKRLATSPETADATLTLSSFIVAVLLQFLAIVYLLGKDITIAPRYHFVYYPAFCALLAASLTKIPHQNHPQLKILAVSFLSSLCVIFNLAFEKPYHPLSVARQLNESADSVAVAIAYDDTLPIALGLSYALELESLRVNSQSASANAIFLNATSGYDRVWQNLSQLSSPPTTLWIFAPGLVREQYPQQLILKEQTSCILDPEGYYRIGIPYQRYRCLSKHPAMTENSSRIRKITVAGELQNKLDKS